MAILHALLRHDRTARAKAELQEVIARHDDVLLDKNVLPLAFHLIGAESMEQALFTWPGGRRSAGPAREVLLGADPPVALTQRAKRILAGVRDESISAVHPAGTVITRAGEDVRWWTWAGYRANATLAATLSHLTDCVQRPDDASLRLRGDLSEALPERLATATLAARMADLDSVVQVLAEPARFTVVDGNQ